MKNCLWNESEFIGKERSHPVFTQIKIKHSGKALSGFLVRQ